MPKEFEEGPDFEKLDRQMTVERLLESVKEEDRPEELPVVEQSSLEAELAKKENRDFEFRGFIVERGDKKYLHLKRSAIGRHAFLQTAGNGKFYESSYFNGEETWRLGVHHLPKILSSRLRQDFADYKHELWNQALAELAEKFGENPTDAAEFYNEIDERGGEINRELQKWLERMTEKSRD